VYKRQVNINHVARTYRLRLSSHLKGSKQKKIRSITTRLEPVDPKRRIHKTGKTLACSALSPPRTTTTSKPTLSAPHRSRAAKSSHRPHAVRQGAPHRNVILRVLKTLHLKRLA